MSDMSVEFSFDDEKLKQRGMSKENVYTMLRQDFNQMGLICTADGEDGLIFSGTGRREDEGRTWFLIISLINTDWFEDCATRCKFTRRGIWTDILADIPRAKYIMKYGMRGVSGQYA